MQHQATHQYRRASEYKTDRQTDRQRQRETEMETDRDIDTERASEGREARNGLKEFLRTSYLS